MQYGRSELLNFLVCVAAKLLFLINYNSEIVNLRQSVRISYLSLFVAMNDRSTCCHGRCVEPKAEVSCGMNMTLSVWLKKLRLTSEQLLWETLPQPFICCNKQTCRYHAAKTSQAQLCNRSLPCLVNKRRQRQIRNVDTRLFPGRTMSTWLFSLVLATVKYKFSKRNFIVRAVFNYVWTFYCGHVRWSTTTGLERDEVFSHLSFAFSCFIACVWM